MPQPTVEQLERARLHAEQARTRYQVLQARAGDAARRLDTRRKIVLGALLLDAAATDERFAEVVAALVQKAQREQDRRAFDGWTPPAPAAPDAATTDDLAPAAPEVQERP